MSTQAGEAKEVKKKRNKVAQKPPGRGSGFSQPEMEALLDLLDSALPISSMEWEAVMAEHNKKFPTMKRTVDSLRRKFNTLHRVKMPTGDPLMKPEVKRAKHIRYKMTDRADLGECDELDDIDSIYTNEVVDDSDDSEEHEESTTPITLSQDTPEKQDPLCNTAVRDIEGSLQRPRPLVRKRPKLMSNFGDESIMKIMEMQMLIENQRQQEERERRAEERERGEE